MICFDRRAGVLIGEQPNDDQGGCCGPRSQENVSGSKWTFPRQVRAWSLAQPQGGAKSQVQTILGWE